MRIVGVCWCGKQIDLQFVFFKKIFFNVYLFLRDREKPSMNGGGSETEGDTESEAGSRLWAVSTEPDAGGARTHGPRDHDPRQRRMLNWLSHPGAPSLFSLSTFLFLPVTHPIITSTWLLCPSLFIMQRKGLLNLEDLALGVGLWPWETGQYCCGSLCLSIQWKEQVRLGGLVGWASDFGSGHDLGVHEFEPLCWQLCADSSETGAASDSVSPSLSAPPPLTLCLSLSKINKHKKSFKKECLAHSRCSENMCWINKCPECLRNSSKP